MPSLNDLLTIWVRKQLTSNEISGAVTPDSVAATDRTVFMSLNAATGVVTGATADFGQVVSNSTAVGTSSAALTAGQIILEGSIDGTRWFGLSASATIAATDFTGANFTKSYPQIGQPLRYMRARVSTAITGGNVTFRLAASTGS